MGKCRILAVIGLDPPFREFCVLASFLRRFLFRLFEDRILIYTPPYQRLLEEI